VIESTFKVILLDIPAIPPLYSSDLSRNHVAVGTEEAELGAGGMDLVASTMVLFSLYTCMDLFTSWVLLLV